MICKERETLPLSSSSFSRCTLPLHPRSADPGIQQTLALHAAPSPPPSPPVSSPDHSLLKESRFDVFFWICVSLDPYPWCITAHQAAACLLWLFWEVITLPIHHRVELIQAIFLIHGLAHSIAIFQVIWYFSIIIVSPFEDSDKGHQDFFSN